MEIIKTETFHELPLNVYGSIDVPLFKASEVGQILELANIRENLRNISDDFKVVRKADTLRGEQNITFIKEPALYMLAFRSHKKESIEFTKWVCEEVLPSIRKTGVYKKPEETIKRYIDRNYTININNECDLHFAVISYINRLIKEQNKPILYISTFGEFFDTDDKRIEAFRKGYINGQCDIIIMNKTKKYDGYVIELKSPKGYGQFKPTQLNMCRHYKRNNYKVTISNDFIKIIHEIDTYVTNIRIPCLYCSQRFINDVTRDNHITKFHKIKKIIDDEF